MKKDKAITPNKGKDIHVGSASDIEMATEPTYRLEKSKFSSRASNMENDIEQARASNMEEDKASSSNKGKFIDVGNASDTKMAKNILKKLYTRVREMPSQQNGSESCRTECWIYKVPKPIRNVNRKAYAPLLIAIGPLHRENKRLEAMEKEKLKYFKKLTEQDGMDDEKMCGIVRNIKNQEECLRHCYSVVIESSDFVEMILLDAVFIIQFFLESNDDTGPKHFEPRMTFDIREDLMLLENQLPLFIIQDIYDRVYPRSQPFLDLATCHFGKYSFLKKVETSPGVKGSRHFTGLLRILMCCKTILGVEIETSSGGEIETSLGLEIETSPGGEKETSLGGEIETSLGGEIETSPGVKGSRHFTDLLRNLMLNRAIQRSYSLNPPMLKYSAVMLRKAGVRFQVTRDSCLVNITFDRGVLKIPQLEVDHNFERLVRNIMALEQCCYSSKAYICSYMKLMDHLIDSAEDVGLLVRKGIIVHKLGNDAAVSKMINNLCENIDNHTCFGDISQKLNDHYDSPFNRTIANLVLGYFPNIWIGTGTVAAAILLILTFIQTIQPFVTHKKQ